MQTVGIKKMENLNWILDGLVGFILVENFRPAVNQ